MKEAIHAASDTAHRKIRSFRNVLLGTILVLTAAVIALAFDPPHQSFLPICDMSTGGSCPTVWQIELVGALGGLLAAVVAMRHLQGSTDPYGLPLVQAGLKVPTGAVTGLLGVVWLQSGVLGALAPQAVPQVFAYVALFGYAQEAFTAFVDNQAGKLLGVAKAGSDATRTR